MKEDQKYISYWLEDELFASPIATVLEVYQIQDFAPLKNNSSKFLGNVKMGALDLPVLDLRKVIDKKVKNIGNESCIIVFDLEDGPCGALVDSLEGIVTIDIDDIQFYEYTDSPIYGIASGKFKSFKLIDPDEMLSKMDKFSLPSGFQQAS